jgi:hypothetical protein
VKSICNSNQFVKLHMRCANQFVIRGQLEADKRGFGVHTRSDQVLAGTKKLGARTSSTRLRQGGPQVAPGDRASSVFALPKWCGPTPTSLRIYCVAPNAHRFCLAHSS